MLFASVISVALLTNTTPQSPAEQFALATGLVDGATTACHLTTEKQSPAVIAAQIQHLAANSKDGFAALEAYGKIAGSMSGWLLSKDDNPDICQAFGVLIRLFHAMVNAAPKN